MDYLFAYGAFSPSAYVLRPTTISTPLYLRGKFIDMAAVWTFFIGVTDGLDVEATSL